MLIPIFLNKFDKDLQHSTKRGLDIDKLKIVIRDLTDQKPLSAKYCNHKLKGEYEGCWECHVAPDWLLIYSKSKTHITFIRLGTHSDLF